MCDECSGRRVSRRCSVDAGVVMSQARRPGWMYLFRDGGPDGYGGIRAVFQLFRGHRKSHKDGHE